MVQSGQDRVFSPVGYRLRVAITLQGQRLPLPVLWEPGMPCTRSEYAETAQPGGFGVYGEGRGRERVICGGELFMRTFSALLWSSECFAALVPKRVWGPNLRKRRRTGASGRLPGWRWVVGFRLRNRSSAPFKASSFCAFICTCVLPAWK